MLLQWCHALCSWTFSCNPQQFRRIFLLIVAGISVSEVQEPCNNLLHAVSWCAMAMQQIWHSSTFSMWTMISSACNLDSGLLITFCLYSSNSASFDVNLADNSETCKVHVLTTCRKARAQQTSHLHLWSLLGGYRKTAISKIRMLRPFLSIIGRVAWDATISARTEKGK